MWGKNWGKMWGTREHKTEAGNQDEEMSHMHIDFKICICYNADRRNDETNSLVTQQKAPEVRTLGLFYSVLAGWLNP